MKRSHKVVGVVAAALLLTASMSTKAEAAQTYYVTNASQLRSALNAVNPGDTISVAPGNYDGGFKSTRSGNSGAKIRLTAAAGGNRDNVKIKGNGIGIGSPYAFHLENANHWVIENVGFENSSKGVVLDRSSDNRLSNINVVYVGEEGVHFRTCSSRNELTGSAVSWTGRTQVGIGEGVYVGSANSNWSKGFGCSGGQDASNDNVITNNWIADTPAEGADLKEGTWGGVVSNNTFERTGSTNVSPGADSAIDVKGNNWWVGYNTIKNPQSLNVDAIQTHAITNPAGGKFPNGGNTFDGNRVYGYWPGYAVNITANTGNTVKCNTYVEQGTRLSNRTCVN